jgi:hypothetical protein
VFFEDTEYRLTAWKNFRKRLEQIDNPLESAIDFWSRAPLVNKHLDFYRSESWPDPWSIISQGKYNELTVSLMIGHTLKLTQRFKDYQIEIRSYLDTDKKVVYNLCCVDNKILNYPYREVTEESNLPDTMVLQAVIPLPDHS